MKNGAIGLRPHFSREGVLHTPQALTQLDGITWFYLIQTHQFLWQCVPFLSTSPAADLQRLRRMSPAAALHHLHQQWIPRDSGLIHQTDDITNRFACSSLAKDLFPAGECGLAFG